MRVVLKLDRNLIYTEPNLQSVYMVKLPKVKSDIKKYTLNCDRCGQQHNVDIDIDALSEAQIKGREPILDNFICPDMATMYRVGNFVIDTTVNWLKDTDITKEMNDANIKYLKGKWGVVNFNEKIQRYKELGVVLIGVPEEYYSLLSDIISAYCCGYFYPAITSAGSLGERILNRLIIKTRHHYKNSSHYKKVYKKNSFDNWSTAIEVLQDWEVISENVAKLFLRLEKFRNNSVHYNDNYNFASNSYNAVKTLAKIIDLQFNYISRKDLFWVFDIPGEIWVKSDVIDKPFVKEFILPHCWLLTPFDEPTASPPIKSKKVPLKPLTDTEFIELRKNRSK